MAKARAHTGEVPQEMKSIPLDQSIQAVAKQSLVAYGVTDEILKQLKEDYGKLTIAGPEDKETYKTANDALSRVRTMRTGVEATRKRIKQPFWDAGVAIDAEAKRLTSELSPIETHLATQIKQVDEENERRRKAEEIRRVQLLSNSGFTLLGQSYVAGNVVVHWDDITRLTEDQLQQTVAAGIAQLEAIKAEQERQRQAALEAERKAKELADLEAQLEAKRRELAALQQPPTPPVDIQMQQANAAEWASLPNFNPGDDTVAKQSAQSFADAFFAAPIQQPYEPFKQQPQPQPQPVLVGAGGTGTQQQNPASMKSAYYNDGWEACKAKIIRIFTEDQTPRKRSEWVEIFQNLKP